MLAQLLGSGVGELCAVTTRYSGGIKLGTGGLVKAYGGGVKQALALLEVIEKVLTASLQLVLDYAQQNLVNDLVSQYQGSVVNSEFGQQVILQVKVPCSQEAAFKAQLHSLSKGLIVCQ